MDYFYLDSSNQPVGPLKLDRIQNLVTAEVVGPDVLVCQSGGNAWVPLSSLISHQSSAAHSPAQVVTRTDSDWMPLTSMIFGIVALLIFGIPLISLILAGGAIALGIVAMQKAVSGARKPLSITGLVTGGLAILMIPMTMSTGDGTGPTRAPSPNIAAIEKVLKEDKRVFEDGQRYRVNPAEQAEYIASHIQKIDTTGCPPEFRLAFQRHVNAWERSVPYIAANTPLNAFLEGFFAQGTGDYSLLGRANTQAQAALQDVTITYQEVKNVAATCGARIP